MPEDGESILSRPVQLRMFTEIIEEFIFGGKELSRYSLYENFIYRFVLRESGKDARKLPDPARRDRALRAERAQFMQRVAWWVFTVKRENRFIPNELPLELLPREFKETGFTDAALREAIVGSVIEPLTRGRVLDRKAQRYYFFPHKSYIEFLAAQHFAIEFFSAEVFSSLMKIINNELMDFIEEGPTSGIENLRQGLDLTGGAINFRVAMICARAKIVENEIRFAKSTIRPSNIYVHYAFLLLNNKSRHSYITECFRKAPKVSAMAAALNCIVCELARSRNASLAATIFVNCLTSLPITKITGCIYANEDMVFYQEDIGTFRAVILAEAFSISAMAVEVSLYQLHVLAERFSQNGLYMNVDQGLDISGSLSVPIEEVASNLKGDWGSVFAALLQKISAKKGGASKTAGSYRFPVRVAGSGMDRFGLR